MPSALCDTQSEDFIRNIRGNDHGTVFEPLFGTGQGSGASPSVWLTLVVILLQTLDCLVPDRINFSSPSGSLIHSRLSDAFVNDTYFGFMSDSDTASFESLVNRLQTIAQKWEHLLFYRKESQI